MMRVGYLGPEGTFSEEIARTFYAKQEVTLQPFTTIDGAIRAAEAGEVDESIVPIENSLEGAVNITLDTLVHDVHLSICAEVILPVRHNLLARSETVAVTRILSHPQALAQCRQTLQRLYPGAHLEAASSSAEAAEIVAQGAKETAAVGSRRAAAVYGLDVIAADLQDSASNCTRFVVLAKQPLSVLPKGLCKTSVVCQMNGEKPGSLCDILNEFASRGVNLTRIESRPARTGLGVYIFFFDMEGNDREREISEALQAVAAKSLWLRNLGSYPAAK